MTTCLRVKKQTPAIGEFVLQSRQQMHAYQTVQFGLVARSYVLVRAPRVYVQGVSPGTLLAA